MTKPRLTGAQCQCGRDEVQLAGSLKVCRGCGADVPTCQCGPVGLSPRGMEMHTTALARLEADIRAGR